MWFTDPVVGDWVVTTRRIPVTLTDHLTSGGVSGGSKGVVVGRTGGRWDVRLDAGWGRVDVRLSRRDFRLHRRGAGVGAFDRRASRKSTVRGACALVLLWPFASYVVQYLWHHRTLDGITESFAIAALESLALQLQAGIAYPGRTLLFLGLCVLLARIAFGRR